MQRLPASVKARRFVLRVAGGVIGGALLIRLGAFLLGVTWTNDLGLATLLILPLCCVGAAVIAGVEDDFR